MKSNDNHTQQYQITLKIMVRRFSFFLEVLSEKCSYPLGNPPQAVVLEWKSRVDGGALSVIVCGSFRVCAVPFYSGVLLGDAGNPRVSAGGW